MKTLFIMTFLISSASFGSAQMNNNSITASPNVQFTGAYNPAVHLENVAWCPAKGEYVLTSKTGATEDSSMFSGARKIKR